MQYHQSQKRIPTKQGKITDHGVVEKLLMSHMGIFPNNIPEFAEKYLTKHKTQKNFAR